MSAAIAITPVTVTYSTHGSYLWTVPQAVDQVTFDVYGAQGGPAADANGDGGLGGRATATIAVSAGDEFQLNVGGLGAQANYLCSTPCEDGGFNGGGSGGGYGGAGGGGASDVRTAAYELADRILVAGGGGGRGGGITPAVGGGYTVTGGGAGGGGGGLDGGHGDTMTTGGSGGGQSAGGLGGSGTVPGSGGTAGTGGAGAAAFGLCCGGGGGGGGYFGGGGGSYPGTFVSGDPKPAGGGGGGSGYGPAGTTFESGVQTGDGKIIISYLPPSRQPDLMIKRASSSTYTGNNIYNSTATGQLVATRAAVGETKKFKIRLQNDGDVPTDFILHGGASSPRFKVRYFSSSTDVTAQFVNGTLHVSQLAPGASKYFTATVKPTLSAAAGDVRTVKVTGTSNVNTLSIDAVKFKITVK